MPEKMRVLVIEDEPDDAVLLARALKLDGFDFDWLRIQTESEYLLQLESPPDVILSDFDLPEFDVLRALDQLKQRGLDIPFVLVTGRLGEDLAVDVIKRGASDYLLKDRLARLGEAVRRSMEQCRLRRDKALGLEALVRSEQRYRSLVESNVVGIMVTDGNCVLEVNDYLLEILGYSREEFDSGAIAWRNITSSDHDCVTNAGPAFETECLAKDGRQVPLFVGSVALGEVLLDAATRSQFLFFIIDLTERKQIEEQFRRAQKLEIFGRLTSGIAHDFNNLLTVISGYSSILLDELSPEDKSRSEIGEIAEAARRSADLTQQLLTFSRREPTQSRNVVLNQIVRNTEKMLKRLIGEDIDLKLSLSEEESVICADPGQIEQVIVNLVVNARDAMPRGGVLLLQTITVPEKSVALAVHDTGEGMTPEVKARIFEPFFTTKESGKGTGLGLSTVSGIVVQSGGTISVVSEPGRGTVFTILFPPSAVATEPTKAPLATSVRRGSETILVAEDDELVRRYVRHLLEQSGYTVLEAPNGDLALNLAQDYQNPIHLFLSDVVMPGIDATDLASRFLAIRPGIPVLQMSGYADRINLERAYIHKPFTPAALLNTIRSILDIGVHLCDANGATAERSRFGSS